MPTHETIVAGDDDLGAIMGERLADKAKRLRPGVRAHRDSTGHGLCWHHPNPWTPLPERTEPEIAVPPRPGFLRNRASLDAPVHDAEHQ